MNKSTHRFERHLAEWLWQLIASGPARDVAAVTAALGVLATPRNAEPILAALEDEAAWLIRARTRKLFN